VWNLADKGEKPLATFPQILPVSSVAISPNGQRVAVGGVEGASGIVRVFDVALGRDVQVFDHAGPVTGLQFLADNRTLVTGSADKNARVLDVGVLAAFEAHKGGVVSAQFNNTGTQALTAGKDNSVKLWDLTKNAVVKTFGPFPEPVRAAVYSRDFTQVGAAVGKNVKVWNPADGKELLTLPHPAEVAALSFSADKARIATAAADRQTRVWEAATGKELQFFAQTGPVLTVLYHPNNTAILSGGVNKLVNVDSPAIQRLVPAATAPLHALTLTPNNTHVVTAGADKTVTYWNLANGAKEKTFAGAADTVYAVAINKANTLLAAGGNDRVVRVYNVADGKEISSAKTDGAVKALQFSPNNAALAAGLANKTLQVWATVFTPGQPLSPEFLKPLQSFTHDDGVTDVAFAADNATLYASSLGKSVKVFRVAADAPTKNLPHPNNVYAVAFHPTLPQVATGNVDGKIRIYDMVKGALVKEINAHNAKDATQIYNVAFSPDGKQIASCSYDASIKLFDAASGNLVKEFKAYKPKEFEQGHKDPVFSLALSPDGKFLASGSGGIERVIKIWDVATGNVVRDLNNPKLKRFGEKPPAQSHPGWVYGLRFTKDGKLVSVGDAPINKGYLAVWNPQDGKLLYGEELPMGSFYALAVSPDGERLAIAAGPRGRPMPGFNSGYVVKMPVK
jgi:WD40 repeat protein